MIHASMPNLFVRDIEASIEFYREVLGFPVSLRVPPEGSLEHAVLRLGDSLLALSTSGAVNLAGLEPTAGNSFELVMWCDDVDQETARVEAAGAEVLVAPYDHIGGHRRAYVADPDGNWVALVDAPRH